MSSMMLPLLAASHLARAAMQVAAPAEPPAILQVYREPLKAGVRAEYDRLESETARQCAQLRCPHAYLGLESLTGPKEVWWFNGYDSEADRKRVARLMRQARLAGRAPRRWKKTTIPDPAAAARADAIRRDFTTDAARINQRWCGDITYLATWEGWLYLATVIDIASRRVVGFALADHLRTELVADALANAVAARDPAPGVIFHSDRGCQYTSAAFAELAEDSQVSLSVGRKGQCWDNAVAESFFASLKGELIDTRAWPARAAACRAVVEYIAWYNGTRLHSTLGYRSPADFENDHHRMLSKVA
jgi:transposase InsO family protein